MSKHYNVWCRVEVYDTEQDEYEDLNPENCEYKVFAGDSIEEVAEFLTENQVGDDFDILQQLEESIKIQGLN